MKNTIHPLYHTRYLSRVRLSERLVSFVWISIAIVVALFLADGGLTEVKAIGGLWVAIGQLTGLVGTDLLVVQLLLISRLPYIDKAFGHDRAVLLHRRLGKPILYLILAHGIALTVGYAVEGKLSFMAALPSMLTLPDVWFAVIGFIFLLAVVGSSLSIARRRLDYDVWFIVHLLAYVAVFASIPHQFSEGNIFGAGTLARYYWIGLYVLTGGSILVFRFIKPIYISLKHAFYVSEVRYESHDVVTLFIKGRNISSLPVSGGQFFMWRFWTDGLWWQAHPFSLSAAPSENTLRVTIRSLGNGSEKIQNIKVGTKVSVEGPYGLFTEKSRTSNKVVFVAAGIGVTPVRAVMEEAEFNPGDATLILRSSAGKPIFLYDEIMALAEQKGVKVYLDEGKSFRDVNTWLSEEFYNQGLNLSSFAADVVDSDVYVCGPSQWSKAVVDDAVKLGIPSHQIHWERFNW